MDWKLLRTELFTIQERCEHGLNFYRRAETTKSTEEQKILAGQLIRYLEENPVPGITVPPKAERDAIKQEADEILARAESILKSEE